jgi:hypothetical protein
MARHGHSPSRRICSWWYCVKCGLVYLNNAATRKAVKAPCPGDDE